MLNSCFMHVNVTCWQVTLGMWFRFMGTLNLEGISLGESLVIIFAKRVMTERGNKRGGAENTL